MYNSEEHPQQHHQPNSRRQIRKRGLVLIPLLVCAVVLFLVVIQRLHQPLVVVDPTLEQPTLQQQPQQKHYPDPLSLHVPGKAAPNLPSLRVADSKLDRDRQTYGGSGDAQHLGGFTDIDTAGISPAVWKHVVANWTVKSVLDVGCGRGISTSWFAVHGLRTECVEGSHDAIQQSMVPDKSILTEHDFSRGPWWPAQTFDMVWSVEFLEHVSRQFHYNYVSTFRHAAILVVTSSRWGGWHHVEVHDESWWIRKYESYGFKYDPKLTLEVRATAQQERSDKSVFPPNGKIVNAQHLRITSMVFVNPAVAALPQHAHLFGEHGCFQDRGLPNRECGKPVSDNQKVTAQRETPLDPAFYPLVLTPEQDQAWYDIVKAHIKQQPGNTNQ